MRQGEVCACRDLNGGGRDGGFARLGDVGTAVSACVRAVHASGRLKEGEGAGRRGSRDGDIGRGADRATQRAERGSE
jgi:hypothetical protein